MTLSKLRPSETVSNQSCGRLVVASTWTARKQYGQKREDANPKRRRGTARPERWDRHLLVVLGREGAALNRARRLEQARNAKATIDGGDGRRGRSVSMLACPA